VTDNTLIALAERCEAATGPDWKLDGLIADELSDWENLGGHWEQHKVSGERRRTSYPPAPLYTASIDAAMTLVPEGWAVGSLEWWPMRSRGAGITLLETGSIGGADWHGYDALFHADARARAATPALALCAAALRARAA
jgi:hypothetical protein